MDDATLLVAAATLAAAVIGGMFSTLGGYLSQRSLQRRQIRTELFRHLVPDVRGEVALTRWGRTAGAAGVPRLQHLAKQLSEVVTVASTAGRRDAKRASSLTPQVEAVLRQDEHLMALQPPQTDPYDTVFYTPKVKAETDAVLTDAIEALDKYAVWLGKRLGAPVPPFAPLD